MKIILFIVALCAGIFFFKGCSSAPKEIDFSGSHLKLEKNQTMGNGLVLIYLPEGQTETNFKELLLISSWDKKLMVSLENYDNQFSSHLGAAGLTNQFRSSNPLEHCFILRNARPPQINYVNYVESEKRFYQLNYTKAGIPNIENITDEALCADMPMMVKNLADLGKEKFIN